MSLTLQDFTKAKQNYLASVPVEQDAAAFRTAFEFFSWLSQMKGNLDLQVVPFDHLTGSDVVAADVPCKVYAILLKKATTTAAFFKGGDSATTVNSAAPTVSLRQNTVEVDQMFFPNGLAMATGFAMISDTTADGSTGSSAGDGAAGVVLLGAA
jgi:hypothetical protein